MLGLGILLFLKLLNLAFILYSVPASFSKMSLSKQMKVERECSLPTQLDLSNFFTEANGILDVWCVHSRCCKTITFEATMRLIIPKDIVACKGNLGERR